MFEIRLAKYAAIIMHCIVCTGLFTSLALAGGHSSYEPVVAIDAEPRHHLVLTTSSLRVFDVSFPPAATSLWHLHDKDSVLVCLAGANVPSEEPGKELIRRPAIATGDIYYKPYGKQPFVHRIHNIDGHDFRILDIEVLTQLQRPGKALARPEQAWSVVLENARVRVMKIIIAAGAATSPLRLEGAHLLVTMTEGSYAIEPTGEVAQSFMSRRGDLHTGDSPQEEVIRNLGTVPIELLLIEVK